MEKNDISYFLYNDECRDEPIVMIDIMFEDHGIAMPLCKCATVELAEKMIKSLEEARDRIVFPRGYLLETGIPGLGVVC